MIKKINKNYTNFDSYEFAEIRRYPYPVSAICYPRFLPCPQKSLFYVRIISMRSLKMFRG